MLFAPFQKSWWKSIIKQDDSSPAEKGSKDTPSSDSSSASPSGAQLSRSEIARTGSGEGTGAGQQGQSSSQLVSNEQAPSDRAPSDRGSSEQSGDNSTEGDSAQRPRYGRGNDSRRRNQARGPQPRAGRVHQRRSNQPAVSAESRSLEDDEEDGEHFRHEGAEAEFETDDPLAPAFDIERGIPLAHTRNAEVVAQVRAKVTSAKEFFNSEILYRFDILEDADREDLKGAYRVELKGYQGGIWTVVVGDQLEVVNRREDAEIVLTMQQSDFIHLVNGNLNPQLALFAQKMRVQGDVKRAVHFQTVLVPSADA